MTRKEKTIQEFDITKNLMKSFPHICVGSGELTIKNGCDVIKHPNAVLSFHREDIYFDLDSFEYHSIHIIHSFFMKLQQGNIIEFAFSLYTEPYVKEIYSYRLVFGSYRKRGGYGEIQEFALLAPTIQSRSLDYYYSKI